MTTATEAGKSSSDFAQLLAEAEAKDRAPEGTKKAKAKKAKSKKSAAAKPLWTDPDDLIPDQEGLSVKHPKYEAKSGALYRTRLIEQFEAIHGKQKWANPENMAKYESSDDEEEERTKTKSSGSASNKTLQFQRMKNLNVDENDKKMNDSGDIIFSIDFNPTHPVALVADNKDRVALYKVDLTQRAKISDFKLEHFNLRKAVFSADGSEILASSGSSTHFWTYNLTTGGLRKVVPDFIRRNDVIRELVPAPENELLLAICPQSVHVISRSSMELIHTFHIFGVVGISFKSNGHALAVNQSGAIHILDLQQLQCIDILRSAEDEGTCSLGYSNIGNIVALGTDSGIIKVKPLNPADVGVKKDISNLTTNITQIKTNYTGELIAFCSKYNRNAIRLYDVRGCKVGSDFPGPQNVGCVNCLNFSPHSGFMAFGNNRGEAVLVRLENYDNY